MLHKLESEARKRREMKYVDFEEMGKWKMENAEELGEMEMGVGILLLKWW